MVKHLPRCQHCRTRCWVPRQLNDGRVVQLATCWWGTKRDRVTYGADHLTATDPQTGVRASDSVSLAWASYYSIQSMCGDPGRGTDPALKRLS